MSKYDRLLKDLAEVPPIVPRRIYEVLEVLERPLTMVAYPSELPRPSSVSQFPTAIPPSRQRGEQ